jgi:transcriptional regulator with XRE-family HTH domain
MSISISTFTPAEVAETADDAASRLRIARAQMGYSIDDVAVTCGLTSDEINAVEDGSDHDPLHLKRIAAALNVELPGL